MYLAYGWENDEQNDKEQVSSHFYSRSVKILRFAYAFAHLYADLPQDSETVESVYIHGNCIVKYCCHLNNHMAISDRETNYSYY